MFTLDVQLSEVFSSIKALVLDNPAYIRTFIITVHFKCILVVLT